MVWTPHERLSLLKWHRHDSVRSLSLEDQTRQRAPGASRLASKRTRGTE